MANLTLDIPEPLYRHLKERADKTRRSVEEESVRLLNASMPASVLPDELSQALAALQAMDETSLWDAARQHLSDDSARELESLNHKQRCQSLTRAESDRLAELLAQFEKHMLVRAEAAVLLKQRGCNVSSLLAS